LIQPTQSSLPQLAAKIVFQNDVSLASKNTFGIAAFAERFADVTGEAALREWCAVSGNRESVFVMGGGSNLLLTQDITQPVLHIAPRGIRVVEENQHSALVEAMAGEPWHAFVLWTLARGLCGLENLSLIPGYVGAAPVQNIGAYGVEIKDSCERVIAVDTRSGELRTFSREECAFGYRDSMFKHLERDRFAITRVQFRLSKTFSPRVSYGDIQAELVAMNIAAPTARDVSNAVIAIRTRKLPDPAVIGNAGSFFKNPVVSAIEAESLAVRFPNIARYPAPNGVKLAAGWLIEQAGWKGKRLSAQSAAGVHEKHALVLVNHGGATGAALWQLAQAIQADVKLKFGVALEAEPRVI
jgi:UDP-N-acetylmuramate dehydrogenase